LRKQQREINKWIANLEDDFPSSDDLSETDPHYYERFIEKSKQHAKWAINETKSQGSEY